MAKVTVEALTHDAALKRLSEELGVQIAELKYISSQNRKHTFEVLNCPAVVDLDIARDGMRAVIRRIRLPVGKDHPPLSVNSVVDMLRNKGVVFGLKRDAISAEVFKILKNPSYDDAVPLTIIAAEGVLPQNGIVSKPKYTFDLKIFDKPDPVFVKKGEVVAIAPEASPAKDGQKVTGEMIPATIEEQGKIQVGAGIKAIRVGSEMKYTVEYSGRLFYDQGIRLRVDPSIQSLNEGMVASVTLPSKSIFNSVFTIQDIKEWVQSQGVKAGILSDAEIDAQLKSQKKWPAQIIVARGKAPVDGKPGAIKYVYKEPKSGQAVDQQRAKAAVVFPGEVILSIAPPSEPEAGYTPYGEALRARPYMDSPVYPGKNVVKEKQGESVIFKSLIYGKVTTDTDRVHVEHTLKVSADKMKVAIDLFPQIKLTHAEFVPLLREADILVSPAKEVLDKQLEIAFQDAKRIPEFVVVEGQKPQLGKDAVLIYRFDPNRFKDKGLFQKATDPLLLAFPGDLILTKMEPMEATAGMDVFREKIPVPESKVPKDVQLKPGKNIEIRKLGKEGSAEDPPRIEYRSARFGTLVWKDLSLDIQSTIEVDKEEKTVLIGLAPTSDLGTRLSLEILKTAAEIEGVRVDLSTKILEDAIRQPRAPDRTLRKTILAEAIPVEHGKNAQIEYLIEINDKPLADVIGKPSSSQVTSADCVRPGDILAVKTPATLGTDGKTVFGKRIPADRGKDEMWFIGEGVGKSADGLQLISQAKAPGFVFLENDKICIRTPVKIVASQMGATITLYPTKNPRFQIRDDKVLGMLDGAGVKFGIKREVIRAAIQEIIETQKPKFDIPVAEGRAPKKGDDGSFVLAVDVGQTVGAERDDGSIDFKNRHVFQNVRKGQVLLIRRPPTAGEDGVNVLGQPVKSSPGVDQRIEPKEGIEVMPGGMEYRAKTDGIVEFKGRSIRVIQGLLVPSDVSFKTGHIQGGPVDVFIKGNVLPDFIVRSEGIITVGKVAEAATVEGNKDVRIRGGIIGKGRGRIQAGGDLETLYISNDATVEVQGDVTVGTEILNSQVRALGIIQCVDGAGTISGGEIWAFKGIKAKVIGATGSEQNTVIYLGQSYFAQKAAEQKLIDEQIEIKIQDIEARIKDLSRDLSLILTERESAGGVGGELQERYQKSLTEKKQLQDELDQVLKVKEAILATIPYNESASIIAYEVIRPGVTIKYKHVSWTLKGELRGVEVRWDKLTSNLTSKRI